MHTPANSGQDMQSKLHFPTRFSTVSSTVEIGTRPAWFLSDSDDRYHANQKIATIMARIAPGATTLSNALTSENF